MKINHKFLPQKHKMSDALRERHRGYMRKYRERIKNGYIPLPPNLRIKTKRAHYHRDYYRTVRDKVINHYSKGKNECACCGEKEPKFLALDHINGGGKKHRKEIKINLYQWCLMNGYPKGFQVLCHNCNMAKGFYGKCPHKN